MGDKKSALPVCKKPFTPSSYFNQGATERAAAWLKLTHVVTTASGWEILLQKFTRGSNNNANEMCGLPSDAGKRTTSSHYYDMGFRLLKMLLGTQRRAKNESHYCDFSAPMNSVSNYFCSWKIIGFHSVLFFFTREQGAYLLWANEKIPGVCQKRAGPALFSNYEPQAAAPASWALLFPTDVINQPGATSLGGPENPPRGEKLQIYCGLETALALFSEIQSEAKPKKHPKHWTEFIFVMKMSHKSRHWIFLNYCC